MNILNTLLLGIIQGLTEFLPVSSSGHLILAQTFMGTGMDSEAVGSAMLLEAVLHVGTAIAVVWVFRKDILGIIRGCVSKDVVVRKDSLTYSGWVIIATIPAAVIGILFKKHIDLLFDTSRGDMAAYIAAFMLFVTAALLFATLLKKGDGGKLTIATVVIIGLMQAIAIAPGISRSGSTIAIALLIGVSREEAGRFSFMLALPAIFGAALLDVRKAGALEPEMLLSLAVGLVASFIVGIIALKWLLAFIKRGKLHYFGYYCAGVAVVSLVGLSFRG